VAATPGTPLSFLAASSQKLAKGQAAILTAEDRRPNLRIRSPRQVFLASIGGS